MHRNSLILAHLMLAALAASSFAQTEPASSQALPAASAPPVSAKAAMSTEGSAAAIQLEPRQTMQISAHKILLISHHCIDGSGTKGGLYLGSSRCVRPLNTPPRS